MMRSHHIAYKPYLTLSIVFSLAWSPWRGAFAPQADAAQTRPSDKNRPQRLVVGCEDPTTDSAFERGLGRQQTSPTIRSAPQLFRQRTAITFFRGV